MKQNMKEAIGLSLKRYNETYMKPTNDRIDNIVAQSGTDNTEIVDARIDSAGVAHTTLNNRILAETKMNDEQLVTYTGNYISAEDTTQGYLKNIEILGNTIQDEEDLADIRSVGDKVEGQELYEIPVLSCGKNLFDGRIEIGTLLDNGELRQDSNARRSCTYISVKQNMSVSCYNPGNSYLVFIEYDNSYNVLGTVAVPPKYSKTFLCKGSYLKFRYEGMDFTTLQLEEGTVATPYEPYIEDKITILSPVQLEKVGDVADRIICKDGVWGVEKNIITETYNGGENWGLYRENTNTIVFHLTINKTVHNYVGNIPVGGWHTDDTEGVSVFNNTMYVRVLKSKLSSINIAGWKELLSKNNAILKSSNPTPTFIPLPHDQQVKLRTFANKTNISFLTEIEGTIKAQVPKSLGATVNAHTEQISNLNKELDRVKKLEESTVSTVETESDFTTVEATSNGYFEDVKLEGKTLVNLCSTEDLQFTLNEGYHYDDVFICNLSNLKLNTDYTFMFDIEILSNTTSGVLGENTQVQFGVSSNQNNIIQDHPVMKVNGEDTPSCRLKSSNRILINLKDIKGYTAFRFRPLLLPIRPVPQGQTVTYKVKNMLLLEGDHTQNPPSYFEGLKSVGQDVDEIVVSSVNENLFDKTQKLVDGFVSEQPGFYGDVVSHNTCKSTDFILIEPNTTYTFNNDNPIEETCGFYDTTKKCITVVRGNTVTSPSNAKYMRCTIKRSDFEQGFQIVRGTQTTKYTPHQSDKKRLLFYNTETQTWEKPVLREWDSIEKHSDGKYYYHQRSGEVVLNGSESWGITSTDTNTIRFYTNLNKASTTNNVIIPAIMDKFTETTAISQDVEGFNLFGITNNTRIRISKTKLSTQDVEGFKQWLQANNVTVVYQLAEEKVYECTNIDLITYANETNYIVESGAISPKTTLKVHNNISNVVSLLQKKVSLLESNMTNYMITQNRMQLASTYSADSVTFKVDYALCSEEVEYNEDLYNLILNNILVGKDNYDYDKMFTMILDYASWNQISWEQFDILVGLMDMQHNPPIEEIPTDDEVIEETPNEIM